jgi:hypothetical protein
VSVKDGWLSCSWVPGLRQIVPARQRRISPALLGVTGNGKLAADRLHGVGMQSESGTGTNAKLDQIEGRWPTTLTTPVSIGLRLRWQQ